MPPVLCLTATAKPEVARDIRDHFQSRVGLDLMLLDGMMPKKSGFEVCEALRADPTNAGLQIVMLTAKGRDTEVAKGLAIGADAYVTKPFSTKELVAKVKSMLGAA